MRDADKSNIETATAQTAANHTPPKESPLQPFLPEGHVGIAIIATPTTEDGKTSLQFNPNATHPFDITQAIGMHAFTQQDVGKRVAYIRVNHTDQLMIMGFIYEGEASENKTLLDRLVDHSNNSNTLPKVLSINESEKGIAATSAFSQEDSALEADIHVFSTDLPSEFTVSTNVDDDPIPRQIILRAQEEITLQCGESYLSLKADGRIKINGKHIHSRATKVQRLSGGSIKLN